MQRRKSTAKICASHGVEITLGWWMSPPPPPPHPIQTTWLSPILVTSSGLTNIQRESKNADTGNVFFALPILKAGWYGTQYEAFFYWRVKWTSYMNRCMKSDPASRVQMMGIHPIVFSSVWRVRNQALAGLVMKQHNSPPTPLTILARDSRRKFYRKCSAGQMHQKYYMIFLYTNKPRIQEITSCQVISWNSTTNLLLLSLFWWGFQ